MALFCATSALSPLRTCRSILASLLMQLSIRHAQDHEGVLFLAPSSAALLSIKAFPTWSSLDKAVLSRIQIWSVSFYTAHCAYARDQLLLARRGPRGPCLNTAPAARAVDACPPRADEHDGRDGRRPCRNIRADPQRRRFAAVPTIPFSPPLRSPTRYSRTHGIACHVVASESSDAATGQTPQRHISSLLASYFPLQLAIRGAPLGSVCGCLRDAQPAQRVRTHIYW